MQTIDYLTNGTCSSSLSVRIEGGRVVQARFEGGCPGNLEAIARLVVGLKPAEVVERLAGIRCGSKATSCADQLAQALAQAAAQAGD
ncbi:MAG: TIGR03905 family protein [Spirochaetes bacterium GWD1_61_31]|nr:MAG: TIGR03905 family protein [Spirochaetes bacterium GWB1_60_80]OHD33501.1 MAG: TIGR03905 family protein [Spirochaetes bacterium GWC1_61_12]OHD36917.1 MAG: TIGR03905 family protein [Spirochaetes bacterium GWD1_61_31]OHD42637.1 MAG: TIGR03905 family protein [Spirochaetes bacterium GWE1_60_18]OHD58019.1 MAG: TIGR03905 family protein [Spirochaetes bacterium GWF1_60_12]HAP42621.1 TIGR03905 family protein [Spirochaetaceae bacterium]